MKKNLLLLLVLLGVCKALFAQEPPKPTGEIAVARKNVVKLNLFPVEFKIFSLQYERKIHKNFSLALGLGMMPQRPLPNSILNAFESGVNFDITDLREIKFSSYFVTPEIRFYPGKKIKHQAPHGFYLGLYGRWAKFNVDINYNYESTSNGVTSTEKIPLRFSYGGTAGGLCMGAQWIINRVSIDWLIVGFHYGSGYFSGEGTGDSIAKDPEGFKQDMEDLGIGNLKPVADIVGSTAKVKIPGIPFAGLRTGLSIGFAI